MRVEPETADLFRGMLARVREVIRFFLRREPPAPLAAAKGVLTRAERRLVLAWLHPLEVATRILIIVKALQLPKAPPRPERPERPYDVRPPRQSGWPAIAAFRVLTGRGGDPPRAGATSATRNSAEVLFSAWPLVARLEAVLAAVENPAPHVRRFALYIGRVPAPKPRGGANDRPPDRAPQLGPLAKLFITLELDALGAPAADTS
jgi:hypothetical protein